MAPRKKTAANNDGLTTFQRDAIREVLAEFPAVELAVLFGSRAMGTWSPASDVDLALFGDALSLDDESSIAARMEDLGLPVTVDLVRHATIKSEALRAHIAREGKPFFEAATLGRRAVRECGLPIEDNSTGPYSESRVSDIVAGTRNALVGGPFGSNLVSRDYVESGVPVIRGQNMGSRFVSGEFVFVTPAKAASLSANLAQPGDVVFTQRGTLGQVALVPPTPYDAYLVSQSQMKLTADPSRADSLFLYYVFTSPDQQEYIHQHAIQTGVPHTNLGILRDTPIPVPPIGAQRGIAQILGALDDKIELNRKMNETLEAMARAIFQSWFVDFDPVHAKARGEQPAGMSAEIAALFPSEFEDLDSAPIPRGWQVKPIGEVVRVVGGSTPSTSVPAYWEGGTHAWATPKDLSGLRSPVLLATERRITAAGLGTVSSGLLPKGVVLMSSRAPVGYVAVSEVPVAINQGFIAMVCDGPIPNDYVLHWLRHKMSEIQQRASGTTFQEISKQNFRPIQVIVPPSEIVEAFVGLVRPLHRRLAQNESECATLAQTRDLLLPKLLSGEIRVSWS